MVHRRPDPSERGQSLAEFTLVAPVLILLLFGLTLSAFYAFRAASADWGVFVTGVAEGAYDEPATGQALASVTWADIAAAIRSYGLGSALRQVRATIDLRSDRPWVYGIKLIEVQQGSAYFRLWRFYPGPPQGDIQ